MAELEDLGLSLRDVMELAKEFGVEELKCGPVYIRFASGALAPQISTHTGREPLEPEHPPTVKHPSLWGPLGAPTWHNK